MEALGFAGRLADDSLTARMQRRPHISKRSSDPVNSSCMSKFTAHYSASDSPLGGLHRAYRAWLAVMCLLVSLLFACAMHSIDPRFGENDSMQAMTVMMPPTELVWIKAVS